jgi:hypothetical protein
MKRIFHKRPAHVVLPVAVACLAAVALLAGAWPIITAGAGRAARGNASARRLVGDRHTVKRPAVKPPAAITVSGARCSAAYLRARLRRPGVTVDAASMNTSGAFTPQFQQPLTGLPSFCDVTLTQLDTAGNPIHIDLWLPATWNGRFQGVGGAVYACGPFYYEMAPAIQRGFAAATTDCGVPLADMETGTWALNNGRLDWPLIHDFAYAGIHDMTVVGKTVTSTYYPSPLRFSYFNGCSTGGREGLMEAQRYPADYNGIVSGAPAINWTKFIPAEIWPQLVMKEAGDFLPVCKDEAFTNAALRACASTGGVITNPSACDWNPGKLVGLATPCGVITQQDADVMAKIWQGPENAQGKRLWYGLERGTNITSLAATSTFNGMTTGQPGAIPVNWLGMWLQRNPSWDWHTLTYAQFDDLFRRSVRQFSGIIATDNPDLSAFRQDGGKIIIWHGLADQLIFPQGTVNYYSRVQRAMGGPGPTDSFARLFLAPGAVHCASGAGPAPAGPAQPLDSLVNWVEAGKAPSAIPGAVTDPATNLVTRSRPLCLYPRVARYRGHGSPAAASSFACTSP